MGNDGESTPTVEQLDAMSKMEYHVCTVADIVNQLAGLPPMMEVFADADGTPMYINWSQLEVYGERPVFLRLVLSTEPKHDPRIIPAENYEQEVDKQRQRAMHMQHIMENSTKMPPMVD